MKGQIQAVRGIDKNQCPKETWTQVDCQARSAMGAYAPEILALWPGVGLGMLACGSDAQQLGALTH
jgi:hypothetical protein